MKRTKKYMEKAIKDEFGLNKRARMAMLFGMLLFLVLSVFVYFKLFRDIRRIVRAQAVNSITNISELNVDSVSRAIKNRRTLFETIAARLEGRGIREVEEILKELEGYVDSYGYYSMGVLQEDMTMYLTDGTVMDVSGRPQFQDAWTRKFHVSESYLPAAGGEYAVNLFSYPVFDGDKLECVLIATYYSKNLTERMNISSMGGKGYNFLLSGQGEVVIYPRFYENQRYNGLMKYINDTREMVPDFEREDRYFTYNGEKYYAHFEQMGVNGWYLMTCAREKDVFADAKQITFIVLVGISLLWLMVLFALYAAVYSVYRSKMDLRKAVFYDDLLGIRNGDFLSVFFKKLPEKQRENMALVILDIDKFKEFNYIYGEDCGDGLLKYIVQVFQEELPQDYLFRYLADHFALLIHCRDKQEIIQKMDRVLKRFSKDMDQGKIQPFDISAGVRQMKAGESFRRIMSDALIAKGTIKGIQVQQYAFYDESILQSRMTFMEMESDFSRALREREFQVYYQPKYEIGTGRVVGAEALVRWIKEDSTMIYPGEFIPCFEKSRQIILLDEAMLENVCGQMKDMEAEGLPVKKVSINLSRVHLKHHGILPKIERIVKESGVDPGLLSFEITESALYEDSIPLKQIVEFLHQLGCRVDMDDYGVGVSGPNALATNRFDVVKLDKSFINGIGDERMEAVIQSTISLSRTLGMEILAEGVEEKSQADKLLEWGCTLAQGFYYSPPVPEKEYRRMLKDSENL